MTCSMHIAALRHNNRKRLVEAVANTVVYKAASTMHATISRAYHHSLQHGIMLLCEQLQLCVCNWHRAMLDQSPESIHNAECLTDAGGTTSYMQQPITVGLPRTACNITS